MSDLYMLVRFIYADLYMLVTSDSTLHLSGWKYIHIITSRSELIPSPFDIQAAQINFSPK